MSSNNVIQILDSPLVPEEIRSLIRDRIAPHFPEFLECNSTAELKSLSSYQTLEPEIRKVLNSVYSGDFNRGAAPARSRYRFVAWNLERGIEFSGQLEALRTHPYLASADVYLLTEADIGMARSENRAVAQEIAHALGLHYSFAPCYLNLSKGAGIERNADGENQLGLHGNAVLSRYPIRSVRPIHLRNGIDKMRGREKRLGRQAALAAEIEFPNYRATAVAVHLDANSSQAHRCGQMRDVIQDLATDTPAILGGDWNTSTYNSSRAFYSILGFWLRVFMGAENVISNHYLHPDHRFERELFRMLEAQGFEYRQSNRMGEPTIQYDVDDPKTRQNLGEWVPGWCFSFIRWALRRHDGKCPLKLDWFATRGARVEDPVIVSDLRSSDGRPLSDHSAIGVDVVVE
ncbi:MAG TPA: endonuclease/exonuclease/phosphatase family protein [Terriglobia bacterium]|nr:endonuclease/exonuclease/phosphatase family protein [Terriglobia bacterium]